MRSFEQYTPTEIVFGKDTQEKVGKLIRRWGGSRVLVVYGGGSVKKSGLLDEIKASMDKEEIEHIEIGGVRPNPRLSLAEEAVERGSMFQVDFVLAVGGGSVIDTAKAVAIGIANPEVPLWDFWEGKKKVRSSAPVGVVLTIAAAGSETSDSAVLTNEETRVKSGVSSSHNRPKFAVMNPEFTYTLPKYQIANGVVDIYMHTLERYFTPMDGNHLTDEIAEGLLRTVIAYGKKAYDNSRDYEAMSEIMWCGSISHNGITGLGRPKDFSNHKLGHELSAMFDATHGSTLSAVWGSWARYVYHIDVERFARYGKMVWEIENESEEETARLAIERTESFFQSLDMPVSIGQMEMGILEDEVLKELADRATKGGNQLLGTFKPLNAHDAYEIYKAANHR